MRSILYIDVRSSSFGWTGNGTATRSVPLVVLCLPCPPTKIPKQNTVIDVKVEGAQLVHLIAVPLHF
jgi:hypothetical protein